MMFFRYIFEWFLTFLVISGLSQGMLWLIKKKWNEMTAIIFSFVIVGLFIFLTAPYFLSPENPEIIYLPIIIFWFVFNLYRLNKK